MAHEHFFDAAELGKTSQNTQYAVYNRNRQELVYRRGTCSCGALSLSFWYSDYDQAELLLNEALTYYPDNEILTIIKKDSVIEFTDTMQQRD